MADGEDDHGGSCHMRRGKAKSTEKMYEFMLLDAPTVLETREPVPNMANMSALISTRLNASVDDGAEPYTNWVGFYTIANEMCTLGPFQGKTAVVKIPFDKGVCGKTARAGTTTVVPNVHEFPGHIACDTASASEIVVPVHDDAGRLVAILDIDSPTLDRFSEVDRAGLEALMALLASSTDWD